jgi:hypothetical protein
MIAELNAVSRSHQDHDVLLMSSECYTPRLLIPPYSVIHLSIVRF